MTKDRIHIDFELSQSWETFGRPIALMQQRAKMISDRIYDAWAKTALFSLRVHYVCGYDPQKLLPAPSFEREFMQSMSEWAAEQIKLPYATVAAHYLADRVSRPLDEIDAFREYVVNDTGRIEPLVMTDTMYDAVQAALREAGIETNMKMVRHMHATFVHESDLGDRTPRGKITIYDYDDRTVIDLEGEGELPGRADIFDALIRPKYPAVQLIKRQPSYLDHDPTKQHRRRHRGQSSKR